MASIYAVSDFTRLSGGQIEQLLDHLRDAISPDIFSKFKKTTRMTELECLRFTGLTKDQFNSLNKDLLSLYNSPKRTKSQALATYLFWLKTGLPYRTIATLFSLNDFQNVGNYCQQVRDSLIKDFVPKNLGPSHISRNEWIKHNTPMVTYLYNITPSDFAIIADGTYCYCQKSQDNYFQRKTWNVYKKASLVKPFVLCSTDGYIVDVYGLYPAVDNDATIIKEILKIDVDLKGLLKSGDHIFVDRGFRDAENTLERIYGLEIHMPSIVPSRQKQLTTFEANQTRFVTKCRWTVEAVNGLMKSLFRANDKIVDNKALPHTLDDFRISAALINHFHKRLFSDKDNPRLIADQMKSRLRTSNKLESILETHGLDRKRKTFKTVEFASIKNFPKLDFNIIKNYITLGSYQLKQSLTYLNNLENIEVFEDKKNVLDPNVTLIRTHVQSRHSNAKTYNTYVAYKPNNNSLDAIDSWFCTCKTGKRTVGCCSHVATLIYKLSLGKNQNSAKMAKSLAKIFPSTPIIETSESEEENLDINEAQQSSRLYPDLSSIPGPSGISSTRLTTTIEIANPYDD